MKNYSMVIGGILVTIAGSAIGTFGLSESCSNEILAEATPFLTGLPGLLMVYLGRVRQGDVTLAGFKKPGYSNDV